MVSVSVLLVLFWLVVPWPQQDHSHQDDLRDLVFLINRSNHDGSLLNRQFPLAPDHIPIVLYVYNRVEYLNRTLEALRNVRGISQTLLIVSHDGVVPEMLQLVRAQATFCRTKVMIHPVSAHRRCTEAGCAIFRVKDHWWWLQRMVWDDPVISRLTRSKWRLFLEEDHLVSRDAYDLLRKLVLRAEVTPGRAWGVGLAPMMARTPELHQEPAHKLDYHWGVQNAGYALPETSWRAIWRARSEFWQFHDGWDITLQYLMERHFLSRQVLLPRLARLRNIGAIGATQDVNSYNNTILPKIPVSGGAIVPLASLHIGSRTLGKDPARLRLKPYPVPLDWDAVDPGQLNNNWEGNDQLVRPSKAQGGFGQVPNLIILSVTVAATLALLRCCLNRVA